MTMTTSAAEIVGALVVPYAAEEAWYRISTITAHASIARTPIDLEALFARASASAVATDDGVAMQAIALNGTVKPLASDSSGSEPCAAACGKKTKTKMKTKKNFGNQMTMVMRVQRAEPSDAAPAFPVNAKLFKNGSIQVAGLRDQRSWLDVSRAMAGWLRRELGDDAVMTDAEVYRSLKVCMICGDFDTGVRFRPVHLLEVLRCEMPLLLTSHEACRHPAVKIKYMHNLADPADEREGLCKCPGDCCGGRGSGMSRKAGCRKVTVLMFHTGKVVITGAVTLQQVHDAYAFVMERVVAPYAHLFCVRT